jgi:hypothetical protein
VAKVETVAFGEHSPAARVEERVDNPAATLGGGAGSPVGANSSEVDLVEKVVSQQARRYQGNQIVRQRRRCPWGCRHIEGDGGHLAQHRTVGGKVTCSESRVAS